MENEITVTKPTKVLVTKEAALQVYNPFKKRLDEIKQRVQLCKLDGIEDIKLVEQVVADVKQFENLLEDAKKNLKGPYFESCKNIDSTYKEYMEPLMMEVEKLKEKLVRFKFVKKTEMVNRIEEIQKEIENKKFHAKSARDYCERFSQTMTAKLIGGGFYTKDGEAKVSNECKSPEEVFTLVETVERNISKEMAGDFEHELATFLMIWKSSANVYSEAITTLDMEKIKWVASRLTEARDKMLLDIDSFYINQYSDELSVLTIAVDSASKGVRKTITYEIEDIELVPQEWLTVDDAKVKEFIKENKDKLEKKEIPMIPGLKITYNVVAVAR